MEIGQIFTDKDINEKLSICLIHDASVYLFTKGEFGSKYCIFIPLKTSLLSSKKKPSDKILKKATEYAESTITKHNLRQFSKLNKRLFTPGAVLESCIKAFCEYAFCDRYILWEYNPYSDVFSYMVKSHTLVKEFTTRQDNSSLYKFLDEDKLYDLRRPQREHVDHKHTKQMKTINRLRLDLGGENEVYILDFLSKYPEFGIQNATKSYIRGFLETKILEYRQKQQVAFVMLQSELDIS